MTSAPWYRTAVPEELRKNLFSKDERPAAVGDYGLRAKIRLPDKTIEELEVRADPEAMVVLKYAATVPGTTPRSNRARPGGRRPHPLPQRHKRSASTQRQKGPATGRRRHFPGDRQGLGQAGEITLTVPPGRAYTGCTRGARRRSRPARRRMAATTLYPRSSARTAA